MKEKEETCMMIIKLPKSLRRAYRKKCFECEVTMRQDIINYIKGFVK